jgi:hypothetical protein
LKMKQNSHQYRVCGAVYGPSIASSSRTSRKSPSDAHFSAAC